MRRCKCPTERGQCWQDAQPDTDLCFYHAKLQWVGHWMDGDPFGDPFVDIKLADYLDDRERRLAELPRDASDYKPPRSKR